LMAAVGQRAVQPDRDRAVQMAIDALAHELAVQTNAIRVVSAEPVDWPDASLGCPEKGRSYVQVITPGFKVRLAAKDREYDVHTGAGRAIVCHESGGA